MKHFREIKRGKSTEKGMTLIGTVVAMAIVGLLVLPAVALFNVISGRYYSVIAKKAAFPFADELKTAVAVDMKSYFTSRRPNTPCADGGDLSLPKSNTLRSGASLTILNKTTAAALPAIPEFALYTKAIAFCQGRASVAPADFKYASVDFSPVTGPMDIFNPPGSDFKEYTSFDFCAQVSCPPGDVTTHNKMCQYANNPRYPMVVVFRYQIIKAENGTALSCNDTISGWPPGAVGKLSYLILWAQAKPNSDLLARGDEPSRKNSFFYSDAGIFHGNKVD